ncbi:hypothetical protein [Rhodococcus sp. Q]|uniref:hypothetical protein n=1 Tax=Rhodococcus sp. Q TaxID=2502252 RepID=UPI0010F6CFEA|nr:hypothetical protein [Rhodococcus sp. Q]
MSRALLAPTLIAALLLAGCGSDTDTSTADAADPSAHVGSEPSIADDPMMACYGRVGFNERKDCVPGVGSMSARDVKGVALPEHAKVIAPPNPADVVSATLEVDGTWLRAYLVPYEVPSRGLTAESSGTIVAVFDLAARKLTTQIDLPKAQMDAVLPDTKNGLFVATLTDAEQVQYRQDEGLTTMAAIDPTTGKALWQKTNMLTSNPVAVIDRGILPAYGITTDCGKPGDTLARSLHVLNVKTGEPTWSKNVTEVRGRPDGEQCTKDVVYADPGLPFIQVIRRGDYVDMAMSQPERLYNITTNLDVKTGEVFAPLPSEMIDRSRNYFVDPRSPLTIIWIKADGNVERTGGETGWLVLDRESGAIVNRISQDTLSDVNASLVGIYDSQTYVKNSTLFTIDAHTNAEGGPVNAMPVREVNGWILHDNGNFTQN